MRNKYLLLGAASVMMLAACSEDINGPENPNKPVENALNLTSLSPASQAGRVSLPGQTRGQKADRLQLVAKIAPVVDDDAVNKNWSATGIAISGGSAYVTWHSNHQATVAAENWGGAIDVIDINALAGGGEGVLNATLVSQAVKFNGIVADGATMYVPATSYTNGAIVGRWNRGSLAMDTIVLPGSSANSVKVDRNDLYAVTGYAGGLYKVNADFNADGVENVVDTIVDMSADFGGKYIAGDYYLRTNDEKSQIVNLNGTVRNEGAPLLSEEKFAEAYDPANGRWYPLTGDRARHYGKHTMAVDGNYIYVGGGQGSNGENGLRVYAATGCVWQNGTNTTAVTVATFGEGEAATKYVFAATGAGLRVYEPYNSAKQELPLYAFEVLNYDENGMAADAPNDNKPAAGTDAHSNNFVAVDSESGLIFVACGQSGVYVFKLNPTIEVEKKLTGFITPTENLTEEIDEDAEPVVKKVPAGPIVDGKTFVKWSGNDGKDYEAGEEKTFNPGETVELTPVYNVTVTFKYSDTQKIETIAEGATVSATKFPTNSSVVAPEGKDFNGEWVIENTTTPFTSSTVVEKNVTVVPAFTDHVYAYTVKFVGNHDDVTVSNLPGDVTSDEATVTIPNVTPTVPEGTLNPAFIGWATDPEMTPAHKDAGFWTPIMPGDSFTCTSANTTLYAIWATNVTAGGNQGGVVEEEKPETGNGGGAGDSNSGTLN